MKLMHCSVCVSVKNIVCEYLDKDDDAEISDCSKNLKENIEEVDDSSCGVL